MMKKLDLDMLEHVNGGVMNENNELFLDELVGSLKIKIKDQKELTTYIHEKYDKLIGTEKKLTEKEVMDYIKANWDIL